jgi:hypothetical protein
MSPFVLFYRYVVDRVQVCVSFYLSDTRCDSLAVRSAHRQPNQMSTLWSPRLNFGPTYPIADCHRPDHSTNIRSPQHRVRHSNVVVLPLLNGEWKKGTLVPRGKIHVIQRQRSRGVMHDKTTHTTVTFREVRSKSKLRKSNWVFMCSTTKPMWKHIGVQMKLKRQNTVTCSAAAWPPRRLCYRPLVFSCHLRLAAL